MPKWAVRPRWCIGKVVGFGWHDALACLQLAELGGAVDDAVRTVGFFDAAHAEDVLAALLYHDARADGGGADDAGDSFRLMKTLTDPKSPFARRFAPLPPARVSSAAYLISRIGR